MPKYGNVSSGIRNTLFDNIYHEGEYLKEMKKLQSEVLDTALKAYIKHKKVNYSKTDNYVEINGKTYNGVNKKIMERLINEYELSKEKRTNN